MTRNRDLFSPRVLVVLSAVSLAVLTGCDVKTHRIPSREGTALTETLALDASRQALEMAGYDRTRLEPVCYRPDCSGPTRYLAKASPEAPTGYVLWRFTDRPGRRYHLDVRLRKTADYIDCEVSKAK